MNISNFGFSGNKPPDLTGYVPITRTLTINGTTYDLSANRTWSVGDLLSSGSYSNPTWLTSLAWSKISGTPTTLAGYGITDAVPSSRTLTINGTTFDLSADRSWTIATGMTNPMTTAGDIIYGGASGTPTRLGLGTSGYVLQAGASAPAWFNLFGTANTFTANQIIQGSVSRQTILNGINSSGYASATTISSGGAGQVVSVTNAQGIIMTFNENVNSNTFFPLFTFANRQLGGFVASVPEWQLRMFSSGTGSTGSRAIEITIPSSTSFNASQIAEKWDIFQTSSTYAFKQFYLRTSIDSSALNPASALLHLGSATTSVAQLNLKTSAGTNPSAPADGDLWYDGTNLKFRQGGTTKTFTLV